MDIAEFVKKNAGEMVEKVITAALSNDFVEVHFNFLDQDQWAVVSIHQYEEDKEIGIRLHPNNIYNLVLGYYDDEDEFFEVSHTLSEEEKDMIPSGLKKVMTKVVQDEQGLRIASNLLLGKK